MEFKPPHLQSQHVRTHNPTAASVHPMVYTCCPGMTNSKKIINSMGTWLKPPHQAQTKSPTHCLRSGSKVILDPLSLLNSYSPTNTQTKGPLWSLGIPIQLRNQKIPCQFRLFCPLSSWVKSHTRNMEPLLPQVPKAPLYP